MFPLDRRRIINRIRDASTDLTFWLEVVAALGMNSEPSSKAKLILLFLSKAKTAYPQHQH